MKALVVGAGIGGLSAALALAKSGWSVTIFEKSTTIKEIGAGVQISPNGMKVLNALGVTPLIENSLYEPEHLEVRFGSSGRKVFSVPLKEVAPSRWGARYIQAHRNDLIQALLTTLKNYINVQIITGAIVDSYINGSSDVSITIKNQKSEFGDLLIGADGLNSAIRDQMHGSSSPNYTGYAAWRFTVPEKLLNQNTTPVNSCVWVGEDKHIVVTRINSGKTINFVGVVKRESLIKESWNLKGAKEALTKDFKNWNPVVENIISCSDKIYLGGLYNRAPLKSWTDNKTVLIGDAAHPMLPSMAQGASQALEDTSALINCLKEGSTIESSIKKFFLYRNSRVSKIQTRSRDNLNLFHLNKIHKKILYYGGLWLLNQTYPELIHRKQDWIYSYNP